MVTKGELRKLSVEFLNKDRDTWNYLMVGIDQESQLAAVMTAMRKVGQEFFADLSPEWDKRKFKLILF